MNSFEKLIRTALARQDASSAQVRTQVYATARAALDRTMRDRSDLSAQAVAQGRRNLETVIREVEAEYAPAPPASPTDAPASAPTAGPPTTAVPPQPTSKSPLSGLSASRQLSSPSAANPAPQPSVASPSNAAGTTGLAPGPAAPVRSVFGDAPSSGKPAPKGRGSAKQEPGFAAGAQAVAVPPAGPASPQTQAAPPLANEPAAPAPDPGLGAKPAAKSRRERVRELRGPTRIYSWILSAALLIAFAVIAVWWVQENDLLSPVADRDGSTANPPGSTASGAASTDRVDEREWVNVLEAVQADRLVVNGSNSARLVDFAGEPLIEMTFADERVEGGDFLIEVDEAILSQYAGRTVLFDLALQGISRAGENEVSLSVECDFAGMGDCGRKRYSVPLQPASMVFSVDLPNVEPGRSGVFRISGVGEEAKGGVIGLTDVRITGDGL